MPSNISQMLAHEITFSSPRWKDRRCEAVNEQHRAEGLAAGEEVPDSIWWVRGFSERAKEGLRAQLLAYVASSHCPARALSGRGRLAGDGS